LIDIFLCDLPIFYVAQDIFSLDYRLYCLLANREVVILQESAKDFIVELSVFIECEVFEEAHQGLGN
jgi:hypothetical protein